MPIREPTLLVVFVQTSRLRWFAASVSLEGEVTPLVCSEEGNLSPYVHLSVDEQISFIRHRLCGVLQRGCDRLFGRGQKACEFVIIFEERVGEGDLTEQVAHHFTQWMLNPPVAVFLLEGGGLRQLAGEIEPEWGGLIRQQLPALMGACGEVDRWELVVKRGEV